MNDKNQGQKRSHETKNKILLESAKLFAEKGFDSCSFRMIGKAADINHAVISYHFGNKDKLWIAVVDYLFTEMTEIISKANENSQPKNLTDGFRLRVKNLITFFVEKPYLLKVIFQESLSDSPRVDYILKQSDKFRNFRKENLTNLQEAGLLPVMPLDDLNSLLSGAITQKIMHPKIYHAELDGGKFTQEMIDSHTDSIINLFIKS